MRGYLLGIVSEGKGRSGGKLRKKSCGKAKPTMMAAEPVCDYDS